MRSQTIAPDRRSQICRICGENRPWIMLRAGFMRGWAASIFMATLVITNGAHAQGPDTSSDPIATHGTGVPLRLEDALARAIAANPTLQGHSFVLAEADARRDQAALRPAYELGLEVENVFGTGQVRTFGDTEATLRLGTVLELGGKRDRRMASADRERELVAIAKEAERLDILAEAARRFILVLAEQERVKLAAQNRDLAARTVDVVRERVAQGRASPVESANAALALVQAELSMRDRETALREAWAALAASWGDPPEAARGEAVGAFADLPPAAPFAELAAAVERNPDIARFASERRVNESKLRLAEANRTPDVTAGLGLRRLQATKDQALVFSVSVPLGSASRSAPYEREALSRLEQGRFEEAAARAELVATLYGLYQRLDTARHSYARIQDAALPEATRAEQLTDDGFRSGRFSLLELTVARQALLAVREQAVATAATYHQLYLDIERLTGRPLAGPDSAQPLQR
ncbi:MAG: TolC family protein [Rhodospirillaceae bacterium]|nr:TolC family protein [Rhodospirillaceae bacterium]